MNKQRNTQLESANVESFDVFQGIGGKKEKKNQRGGPGRAAGRARKNSDNLSTGAIVDGDEDDDDDVSSEDYDNADDFEN